MNRQDYLSLITERSSLRQLIQATPGEDVIDLASLKARLEDIEARVREAGAAAREPTRVSLTFGGRPVVGSHGIFADFGAKVVDGFSEAVAAVAASLREGLAAMGRIPNREQYQLLITGTALGSFGFELEENLTGQLSLDEQSPVEQAVERTWALLQGTVEPDDEMLADAASELDQRALDKVRTFISALADNGAVCALQFKDRSFRFADVGQVRRSLERLGRDNLREEEQFLMGVFEGILPKGRTFEFKLATTGEVIRGKVGQAIEDAGALNRHLGVPARIKLNVTRVGEGRPRFVLIEAPGWMEQSGT